MPKRTIRHFHAQNRRRAIVWVSALIITYAVIAATVYAQYGSIGSVVDFLTNVGLACAALLLLTLLWWFIATTEFMWGASIRAGLEMHSAIFSIIFVIVAVFISVFFYLRCNIIYDTNQQNRYGLWCIAMLPETFILMMYFCPPVNISKVILPGRGVPFWILRTLVTVGMTVCLYLTFIYNFVV